MLINKVSHINMRIETKEKEGILKMFSCLKGLLKNATFGLVLKIKF